MNIVAFRQYREENFQTKGWGGMIHDKRKRPQILAHQIFECISEAPVFGETSLLEMDAFLRSPKAIKYYGSSRSMVASNTTLERVTKGMVRSSVQDMGYTVIDKADEAAAF